MQNSGFAGEWKTDFGLLEIELEGNQAFGEFGDHGGELEGFVTGPVLRGRWSQRAAGGVGITWGECVLTLDGFGQGFTGTWTYEDDTDDDDEGTWNGKRVVGYNADAVA